MDNVIDNELKFRNAKFDELENILKLYGQLIPSDSPLPGRTMVRQIWKDILKDKKINLLVAEKGGKIVATCVLTIIPNLTRGGKSYALIENVVTEAEYRKKGIGTELLRYAQQLAWDTGCYKIMLMTGRQREDIFRFYENAGFIRGTKTAFIIRKD